MDSAYSFSKADPSCLVRFPYLKQIEDDLGEQRHILMGFGVSPIFRVEDTEGEPLEYENIEVPDFRLIVRALEWGFNVKAVPGNYK